MLEGGDGPPLVLVHSAGEFAAVWLHVVPDLVTTHRVIVPELPGHGASEADPSRLDGELMLRWLDELIGQTCGDRPPVVVGHLLGGAIAARYAVEHSDRLAHLVLVDTLGLGWYRPAARFALPMARFSVRPTKRSWERVFSQCFADIDRVAERGGEHWQWLERYAYHQATSPSVQAAVRRLTGLGLRPIPAAGLAKINIPVALIHGRHDLQVRLRHAEAAAERHGWPLYVIDECGDDPAGEQPEEFLRAVRTVIRTG